MSSIQHPKPNALAKWDETHFTVADGPRVCSSAHLHFHPTKDLVFDRAGWIFCFAKFSLYFTACRVMLTCDLFG